MLELDRLIATLDKSVEKAIDEAAKEAADLARSLTKGRLARSIRVQKTGRFTRVITSDVPYAEFVENGRGPVVARGKALHFRMNGQDVFVKRVGPAKARPFLGPANEFLEEKAAEIVARALGDRWSE